MKTVNFSIFLSVLIVVSCTSTENQNFENTDFEICETVPQYKLSGDILNKLTHTNINIETDTISAIVGYIQKDDSIDYLNEIGNDTIKFLTTTYPIDPEGNYIAIVAVKNTPALNNPDIKKTKPNKNNVEIYFNREGAKKWADFTRNSIGDLIAFTIDNKIYSVVTVNGEINNGVALIYGLENEAIAINISESINSGLKD